MHGERLGLGYWIFGLLIIAASVGYWHMSHPFNQPTIVSAPAEGVIIEAVDALKPAAKEAGEITPVVVPAATAASAAPATVQEASAVVSAEPAPSNAQVYDVPVIIQYTELMQSPKLCPKKIRLKAETNFPATLDGKVIGTVTAPAGSEVDFIKVVGEKSILVGFGPAEQAIDAESTNFEELYTQNVKASRKH